MPRPSSARAARASRTSPTGAPRGSAAKVQRWIDLIAALLAHRYARTFLQLASDVPAYGAALGDAKALASVKRAFERDKQELRALGVPLVTEGEDGEEEMRYRLATTDFYLPYLSVATPRGRTAPRRVDRYGYQALRTLTFEPDELEAVAAAARRAERLGDPALAADARSAIRKLAFDLPIDGALDAGEGDAHLLAPRALAEPAVLRALGDALVRRRRVSFAYRAMESDATTRREVEPYGLFFLGGHWYLAARDVERGALRNFRVNRIAHVELVAESYDIPADFALREHARSRRAWELGDGDAIDVDVELTDAGLAAANGLGEPAEGGAHVRRFRVRRPDAFVRWLLSFAGDARPIAPESLVAEYRRQLDATLALYAPAPARSIDVSMRVAEGAPRVATAIAEDAS
jgi:proteasome accessory factor B